MREGWNFHGDIAISLEGDARRYFQWLDRPFDKIFDADSIEHNHFVEDMIILLRDKTNYTNENEEIESFVEKCSKYFGVSGNTIPSEEAQSLYDEFTTLFK